MSNKGTGAGGANTNKNGKAFEEATSHLPHLTGFTLHPIPGKKGKYDTYHEKQNDEETITYLSQGGLKSYFAWKFGIEMIRHPDEAYLIQRGKQYTLRVLEKKNQNVEGSVDTKLLAGPMIQEEYKMCLEEKQEEKQEEEKKQEEPQFKVEYAFCLSNFLKESYVSNAKKWALLRAINQKYGIRVFFGDDETYHEQLDKWIMG